MGVPIIKDLDESKAIEILEQSVKSLEEKVKASEAERYALMDRIVECAVLKDDADFFEDGGVIVGVNFLKFRDLLINLSDERM